MIFMTEDEFQKIIALWLNAALPEKSLWHHSPNEGKRHVAYVKRLIDLGMKPGFPDIEIFVHKDFWWSGIATPIFIEVKAPGRGRLSDKQKIVQEQLLELGCAVTTVNKLSQQYYCSIKNKAGSRLQNKQPLDYKSSARLV